jgi:NADH-quinone oxidoreductase subunit C
MAESLTEAAETAESPGAADELEVAQIRKRFPDAIVEVNAWRGDLRITVRREQIPEILEFLRDDPEMQFSFFSECLGVDYLDPNDGGYILGKQNRFEVVYNLYSMPDSRTGKG